MSKYEACIEFLLTRRSIRSFEPKEVPPDLVYKILDVARYAPSAMNRQPWVFIVVKSRELLDKLAELHVGAKPLKNAPLAIVVACDSKEAKTTYQVDCANAAMYIMLAAHAYGLGTVWIQALEHTKEIQNIVGLPEHLVPVAIIAMGWPAEKPEPKPRKSLTEILYIDKYGVRC